MAKLIFTESYNERVRKFFKSHPELLKQYEKTLKLLELNPSHPSLRLHKLEGRLSKLYSVLINISYRITIIFLINKDTITPVYIGSHEQVY